MSEARIIALEEVMKEISNMMVDDVDRDAILSQIDSKCLENDIDKEQVVADVENIHNLLDEQGASRKKIERTMESPLTAYDKYRYIKLVKSFILDIKNHAYANKKSEDIKTILEEESDYRVIMFSKNKSLVGLRKSIPKLVKIVREMKAKDKTEEEIIAFLYKHLFSYIKF